MNKTSANLASLAELVQELTCIVGSNGDKWIEERLKSLYQRCEDIRNSELWGGSNGPNSFTPGKG